MIIMIIIFLPLPKEKNRVLEPVSLLPEGANEDARHLGRLEHLAVMFAVSLRGSIVGHVMLNR